MSTDPAGPPGAAPVPDGGARPGPSAPPVLRVDPTDAVPPFEQVRRQVTAQAASGALPPGQRLPTVRALADQLGLAVNTVARAYRELERDGVVVTRGRSGTFVAVRGEDREREGRVAAREYLRRAHELGLTPADALRLVREAAQEPAAGAAPGLAGRTRAERPQSRA